MSELAPEDIEAIRQIAEAIHQIAEAVIASGDPQRVREAAEALGLERRTADYYDTPTFYDMGIIRSTRCILA